MVVVAIKLKNLVTVKKKIFKFLRIFFFKKNSYYYDKIKVDSIIANVIDY